MEYSGAGSSGFFLNSRGTGLTKTGVAKVIREEKPTDIIPVPIRVTGDTQKKGLFGRKKSSQDVKVKMMTREEYWKHYAKDEKGNYVGMEDPADDSGVIRGLNWDGVHGDGGRGTTNGSAEGVTEDIQWMERERPNS